jgi:hypothetical protein
LPVKWPGRAEAGLLQALAITWTLLHGWISKNRFWDATITFANILQKEPYLELIVRDNIGVFDISLGRRDDGPCGKLDGIVMELPSRGEGFGCEVTLSFRKPLVTV